MSTKNLDQLIGERAYEIYLRRERDGKPGDQHSDWAQAVEEIAAEAAAAKAALGSKVKVEAKIAPKAEIKPEAKVAPKVEVKVEAKVAPKAEIKPEVKVAPKAEMRPALAKVEFKKPEAVKKAAPAAAKKKPVKKGR